MNLLDLIEEAPESGVRVEIFDADTLTSVDDLTRAIPGLAGLQSPFVGYWVDNRLVESAEGFAARQLVTRVLRLDTTEVEQRMNTVLSRV
jgi:hypothetical protein